SARLLALPLHPLNLPLQGADIIAFACDQLSHHREHPASSLTCRTAAVYPPVCTLCGLSFVRRRARRGSCSPTGGVLCFRSGSPRGAHAWGSVGAHPAQTDTFRSDRWIARRRSPRSTAGPSKTRDIACRAGGSAPRGAPAGELGAATAPPGGPRATGDRPHR